MKITEKKIINNTVTFKCASCGYRGKREDAFNLTISCCSEACFSAAFKLFMQCGISNGLQYPKDDKYMEQFVKDNPYPDR